MSGKLHVYEPVVDYLWNATDLCVLHVNRETLYRKTLGEGVIAIRLRLLKHHGDRKRSLWDYRFEL